MYYNYQIDKSFSNFADVILRYSKNTRVQKLLLLPTSRYIYIYITIEGIMRHNSRGCGERDARLSASVIQIIHFTSFVTPYLSSYRPFFNLVPRYPAYPCTQKWRRRDAKTRFRNRAQAEYGKPSLSSSVIRPKFGFPIA